MEHAEPIEVEEALHRAEPEVERVLEVYRSLSKRGLLRKGCRALEIGIGYGAVAFTLAELAPGLEIFATEHPGRQFLQYPAFTSKVNSAGIGLVAVDLNHLALPWEDGFFDVIIFVETIEHLPPTIVPDLMLQFSALLKDGGYLLASSNNLTSLLNRLQFCRGRTSFVDLPQPLAWAGNTYGHIRFYTVEEMRRFGVQAGLRIVECTFTDAHMKSYRQSQPRLKSAGMGAILAIERAAAKLGRPYLREGWQVLYRKEGVIE